MNFNLEIFIAIILSLSITFADKIDVFENDIIFALMTGIFIYNILFIAKKNPSILMLFTTLYIVVWSIRLINRKNNKTTIKTEIKKNLTK